VVGAPSQARASALKTVVLGQRVADIGSPEFQGTIVELGPQVSLVQWDNRHVRGLTQYVGNEMLIDCGELKPVAPSI
jgi:hypothetical protein